MIKKVLIFFVLVSLVVILTNSEWEYAGARGQAPPRDYSDEGEGQGQGQGQEQEQEPTRGYPPQR